MVTLFGSQTAKQQMCPATGISEMSRGAAHSGVRRSHKKERGRSVQRVEPAGEYCQANWESIGQL